MKIFKHDFVDLPKLQRVESDGKRFYLTPSGKKYQSVTTLTGILSKKAIADWRRKVGEEEANRISTRAANRGTKLHKTVEHYLRNEPYSLNEDYLNKSMFIKIRPALGDIDNIKVIEGTMYSDTLELAGTADCIAEYKGSLSIIDFKTSTKVKSIDQIKGYWMQGAAYGKMYEEFTGVKPEKIVIIFSVENVNFPVTYEKPYEECLKYLMDFIEELNN